jgi:hypothetical protein
MTVGSKSFQPEPVAGVRLDISRGVQKTLTPE